MPGYPAGNWVGPTLLSGVTPGMECYREEIFGPVLVCLEVCGRWVSGGWPCVLRVGLCCGSSSAALPRPNLQNKQVDTLDEALAIVNANEHGNGTALFTASGAAARRFQTEVDVGMVRAFVC